MLFVRHLARQGIDLVAYGARTGRWWFPMVLLLLAVGAVLAITAKAVIPSATYVLF
jgi:hypothetical protein